MVPAAGKLSYRIRIDRIRHLRKIQRPDISVIDLQRHPVDLAIFILSMADHPWANIVLPGCSSFHHVLKGKIKVFLMSQMIKCMQIFEPLYCI